MKRVIFILISAVMLLTACVHITINLPESSAETAVHTQIDPSEEFNGALFGMTMEEAIDAIGYQPNSISQDLDACAYYDVEFLGVKTTVVNYWFDNDGDKFGDIGIFCEYLDESEKEQLPIDYAIIKEELLKRYPEEIRTDYYEKDEYISFTTENRRVSLKYNEYRIFVLISPYPY